MMKRLLTGLLALLPVALLAAAPSVIRAMRSREIAPWMRNTTEKLYAGLAGAN